MRIKNLFFGACTVVALAACSGSEELVANQQPLLSEDGTGYISFSVGLPSDKGTRANDNFHEGSAWEYKVNNVSLLLFKGTDEASAIYQSTVKMKDIDFGDPMAANNVSLDKKYVAKITGMQVDPGQKIYALAVINHNNVFDLDEYKVGGHGLSGLTISDIQGIILNQNVNANGTGTGLNAGLQTKTGGILMLNAPLSTTKGSTTDPVTDAAYTILQDVSSSIYPTENEARMGVCSNIYVERAVAKVTVVATSTEGITKDQSDNTLFSWAMDEWWLDNTNTKSYVVRNMGNWASTYDLKSAKSGSVYRMIGYNPVNHQAAVSAGGPDNGTPRYRTYFAIDPNYDVKGDFNKFTTESHSAFGTDKPVYCAENVFDVDRQVWSETTRALVGVTLKYEGNGTFYAHPGDASFLTEEAVKEMAYNAVITKYRAAIKTFRDHNLLDGSINFASPGVNLSIAKNTSGVQNADEVRVTLPTGNITVGAGVTDAMVAAANIEIDGNPITTKAEVEAHLATVNHHFANQTVTHSDMGVRYYNGGKSYYQVRIKHFGDDLTPWNDGEASGSHAPRPGNVSEAYPSESSFRAANYLGRYGVLRNNWYEITLTNIVKIGYPTLEDLDLHSPRDPEDPFKPNTPDDHIEKEQWINAEVNILSWAKRTQSNNLGED